MTGAMPVGSSRGAREARVHAVLRAARRIADPRDPLGDAARRALPSVTGLSAEGVELGLSRHLETDVSDEDLAHFVDRAGTAPRVHVVLSANVFVGAVRAIALGVASAPSVRVRPSSREAVLAPLLLRALAEEGTALDVALVGTLDPAPLDHVHVYGRRETIDSISKALPAGVVLRGHGPGFGLAVVDATAPNVALAAAGLSWDISVFDQRGCLSPRIALVEGSKSEIEHFARTLVTELELREREVPRGTLSEEERSAQALYRQTLDAVGQCHVGTAFAVGIDLEPRALLLPPPGRHVHVVRAAGEDSARRLLDAFRGAVTCVGTSRTGALAPGVIALLPAARVSSLGQMQKPPLDGPVDLREVV